MQVLGLGLVCSRVSLTPLRKSSLSGEDVDNSRQRPEGPSLFLFSTETPTFPVQQTMILERLPHQIESCRAAADDANMFHCPNPDCTQYVENLFNVVSQQTPSMTCEVEELNF